MGDARLVAPVDQPVRRKEKQVNDPRIFSVLAPEQGGEKLGELGTNSAERSHGGKEGIEKVGTHDGGKMPRNMPVWQADNCRLLLYRGA